VRWPQSPHSKMRAARAVVESIMLRINWTVAKHFLASEFGWRVFNSEVRLKAIFVFWCIIMVDRTDSDQWVYPLKYRPALEADAQAF
jgi:hypothetical protein